MTNLPDANPESRLIRYLKAHEASRSPTDFL